MKTEYAQLEGIGNVKTDVNFSNSTGLFTVTLCGNVIKSYEDDYGLGDSNYPYTTMTPYKSYNIFIRRV